MNFNLETQSVTKQGIFLVNMTKNCGSCQQLGTQCQDQCQKYFHLKCLKLPSFLELSAGSGVKCICKQCLSQESNSLFNDLLVKMDKIQPEICEIKISKTCLFFILITTTVEHRAFSLHCSRLFFSTSSTLHRQFLLLFVSSANEETYVSLKLYSCTINRKILLFYTEEN